MVPEIDPSFPITRKQLEPYKQLVHDFSLTRFAYAVILLRWGLYRQAAEMMQLASRHLQRMDNDTLQSDFAEAFVIGMFPFRFRSNPG